MTFNPPSVTMESESDPPLIRLGKVEKIGKQGGRQWFRYGLLVPSLIV